jgi:ribosomal protein S18 acetylase RimI-like enzyme
MLIRAADLDDVDELASCIVTSWLQAHEHQIPLHLWQRRRENWTVDASAAAWKRTLLEIGAEAQLGSHVLVATESERIVGLVAGIVDDGGAGEVIALYVGPEHQHRGVGKRLLEASFDALSAAGASTVRIVVLAANLPARRFYERLGGSEAGSAEVDEDEEVLPAIVYTWFLDE